MRHSLIAASVLLCCVAVIATVSQLGCEPRATDGSPSDGSAVGSGTKASDGEMEQQVVQPGKVEASPQVSPNVEAESITFDDLNIGMPADIKFRSVMLDYNDGRVKTLLGKNISVAGYMNPTDTMNGVQEFILLRNLECKFGPGGQADHLVHVLLQGDLVTDFTNKVVYVEGTLELNEFPEDGPATWSIYDLKATKVSTKPPPRRR